MTRFAQARKKNRRQEAHGLGSNLAVKPYVAQCWVCSCKYGKMLLGCLSDLQLWLMLHQSATYRHQPFFLFVRHGFASDFPILRASVV